jgi:selenocysteine lyase/cysteine desulfurase
MTAEAQTYRVADVRKQLPSLADVTYMNSGTEGIMAEPVLEAYLKILTRFERYGHWGRVELASEMAGCRERFARLLNAEVDEVCVTRNGTDGVSLILGSYPFKAGDELIIGGEEHPAIVYPAFALQTFKGVRVRRFAFHHDPAATLAAFQAELGDRTVMAAFSHVSCETGTRTPAAEIVKAAHARGVQVLLDGAQSVGSFPVDFRALDCDYLTGSAHKWLCGPKGTGVLVIRRDRLDGVVPAYVGGGSLADGFPWGNLADPGAIVAQFAPSASKFEYGMRNPAIYAGLSRAIDYLAEIGWDAIAAHERQMATRLKQRLSELPGVRVQTPAAWEHSSAIVNLAVDGVPGRDVSKRLWDEYRIVQRAVRDPDGVRISNAYFASDEDHDRLIDAIKTIGGR